MNAYQEACARSYGEGEFAYMIGLEGQRLRAELDVCGDTVFKSLMIELATEEDCDTAEEAVRRCDRMVEDVRRVSIALMELDA